MIPWQPGREDLRPALLIALLPLAVALPQLVGITAADPVFYTAYMNVEFDRGILHGVPIIDPNNGFQTEALGYRAAEDWVHGRVPWWNPYSGVGLPLAAEYQPGAFFPLTFLMLLPRGILLQQSILCALAGLGTYALLRQIGMGRFAATLGAILFAFNGTLAWLSHGPAQPVPFLPWLLLGIERAAAKSATRSTGGWRTVAAAMGLSLLAGFPETAYIDGLFAFAWSVVRGLTLPAAARAGFALRVGLGGIVGIGLAAPQIAAFAHLVANASIGGHGDFAHAGLPPFAAIPSLVAPYVFGPIMGYVDRWPVLQFLWGGIGGYASLMLVAAAAYGGLARRDALSWMLIAWSALALGKTFLIEPAVTLWNLVPGVSVAAFARYAQPTWEFALVVLAVRGIDRLVSETNVSTLAWWATLVMVIAALAASGGFLQSVWPQLAGHRGLVNSVMGSAAWAIVTAFGLLALMRRMSSRYARSALALLLAADAVLLFSIPMLSSPRKATLDMPAVEFLRANLGLQRFYTLGPIQPNYGAYFAIASVNHNYLPVPERWASWVQRKLDNDSDDALFVGHSARGTGVPGAGEQLIANLAAYQWIGVRYVVTASGDGTLAGVGSAKPVYRDSLLAIYELPNPKPYYEALDAACIFTEEDRGQAVVECPSPTRVVRRELFFPGWSATVNGANAVLAEHGELFQMLSVPAGRSELRFRYAPPDIGWAWLAAAAAAVALVARRPGMKLRNG